MIVFADSHGRGLESLLVEKLKDQFEIRVYSKSGAMLNEVCHKASEEAKTLGENDWVVVIGGTYNIKLSQGNQVTEFKQAFNKILPIS